MPLIQCDGECGAAKALRAEVEHLRSLNLKLTDTVASMADPLLHARIAQASRRGAAPSPIQRDEEPRRISAAGLRETMEDRPDEEPRRLPSNEDIHASFSAE